MAITLNGPVIESRLRTGYTKGTGRAARTDVHDHLDMLQPAVGSSAGNLNKSYQVAFTVTAGTPFTLDLTALTAEDGSALSFGFVGALKISNSGTAGQDFSWGGGTNGLVAAVPLPIYGGASSNGNDPHFQWAAPNPGITVDGTHKIIQITVAAGTAVAGFITIMGR